MIAEEGEPGPVAVEGGPIGGGDLGEYVRGEHVEHDVDEVAGARELVDPLRRQLPAGVRCPGATRGGCPIRGRCDRRQQQDRRLKRHQERARQRRSPRNRPGEDRRQGDPAYPEPDLGRSPPCVRRQVESGAVQQPVVGDQQVPLHPEQHAEGTERGHVARKPPPRQDDPERCQSTHDGAQQPEPAWRQVPERHQELGPIGGVYRPRAEDKKLTWTEERGQQQDPQAGRQLLSGQGGGFSMDHAAEQQRGDRPPDQQDEHLQHRRRRQHPVGGCARIFREQPAGAEGYRIAAGGSPLQVEAGCAAVLPVVDIETVGACVELHRAHRRGHAGLGVPFDDDLAVQAQDHAIVGGGVKVDPLRAGGKPNPVPANQVVPRGMTSRVDEREVDRRDSFFDDRCGQ